MLGCLVSSVRDIELEDMLADFESLEADAEYFFSQAKSAMEVIHSDKYKKIIMKDSIDNIKKLLSDFERKNELEEIGGKVC
jgi:hypothetical protein